MSAWFSKTMIDSKSSFWPVKVGEHDRCQPSFIAIRHAVKNSGTSLLPSNPIIDRIGLSIRDRRQVVPLQPGLIDETGQVVGKIVVKGGADVGPESKVKS